jgi:hypothetical protein
MDIIVLDLDIRTRSLWMIRFSIVPKRIVITLLLITSEDSTQLEMDIVFRWLKVRDDWCAGAARSIYILRRQEF